MVTSNACPQKNLANYKHRGSTSPTIRRVSMKDIFTENVKHWRDASISKCFQRDSKSIINRDRTKKQRWSGEWYLTQGTADPKEVGIYDRYSSYPQSLPSRLREKRKTHTHNGVQTTRTCNRTVILFVENELAAVLCSGVKKRIQFPKMWRWRRQKIENSHSRIEVVCGKGAETNYVPLAIDKSSYQQHIRS